MVDISSTSISLERKELLMRRYAKFVEVLDDVNKEPLKVFDPLSQKSIEDIYLIREVSADLQYKKVEEMKRLAQAAQESEAVKTAEKNLKAQETTETDETPKEN